ncbi:MOSC domain protein [Candidatus Syntrophocurvum alkaliphilum]|uniref:MOSC domain protein n=1 Tax=Candidatus Syntrophocurvum alkaliphilum TaxID=2293317 RepID=A0A6I6DGG9_9FIRM|nr:MOSC domain-containing protein [Candidatus Syntrophocurvum alkaliphilum]QGT98759.1 MOSC domain protein [Candidatus Syntrophocurvum alkaliphilum]
MSQKGTLYSICISEKRGELKHPVQEAKVIENFGIENDGHAGDWDRQVTCLDAASVKKLSQDNNLELGPGQLAENLLIEGIDLKNIKPGQKIKIGNQVIIEIVHIGKEDHPSVVTKTFGVSLLPYEGLFCKVLKGGEIKPGNIVEVM